MHIRSLWRWLPAQGGYPGAVSLLFFLLALGLPVAQAATYIVTNLDDSGPGSLRQAVLDANASAAVADTIQFQAGLTGTITLTSGEIAITDRLTLNGPGAEVLTITGNGNGNRTRIFNHSSAGATLQGLTLREGGNVGEGGAIFNSGLLTLNRLIVSDNSATKGGAIFNSGSLTMTDLILSANRASQHGGGIQNAHILTLYNSTLVGNYASGYGGGIDNVDNTGGNLTLINSTLVGNRANSGNGGGIQQFRGNLTLINSTLAGNLAQVHGGGVAIANSSSATATVINSTLSGNAALSGSGGGFHKGAAGILNLGNSLVAGNFVALAGQDIYATADGFISQGANLFGENGASGIDGGAVPLATDRILAGSIDTAISELADNGGPTQTYPLVAGSPAINAGDNALIPEGVTTDQRGDGYPRIVDGTVDIGAVEFGSSGSVITYPLTVSKTDGNGTVTSSPTGINCGATCSASFTPGVSVTLTAAPDSGYSLSGWSGDCSGVSTTCTVTMDAAKSVTALFANVLPSGYTVTALASTNGSLSPATQTVNPGATVTFTVTADPGYSAAVAGCDGTLSGTTFTTGAVNADCTVLAVFTPTVAATLPAVTTPELADAIVGLPYGLVLTAAGGQYPYTFAAAGLPAGLTLSADGVLSGIPSVGGVLPVTVTVTDGLGQTGARRYNLTVTADLTLATTALAEGLVNAAYRQPLYALGGTPPYLFSARDLPAGLTLSSSGLLSGVPTQVGAAAVQITIRDALARTVTHTLLLRLSEATLTFPNPHQPAQAIVATPTLAAGCTVASTETTTLKPGDPGAPATGPDGVELPYGLLKITVRGCGEGQTVLALTTVYPESLPPETQYWNYGRTADRPTDHWYVLPGVIINGNAVTLLIIDGDIGDSDLSANGSILAYGGPGLTRLLRIEGAPPAASPLNEPYQATLKAISTDRTSQGLRPASALGDYVWSIVAGALPPGLSLETVIDQATLSGTPTQAGIFDFILQVIDRMRGNVLKQQGYRIEITGGDPAVALLTHYYVSILDRAPEADGLAFWHHQIIAKQQNGQDVKPVFRDMANFFFNSPEYLGRHTSDLQFTTNLYRTFFQREPEGEGLAFWLDRLAMGDPRNNVMAFFLHSPEFLDFMLKLGF